MANLAFRNVPFNFATAISKFDTFSIVRYHIVRRRIAKVTDFLSFCPFGINIPFLQYRNYLCTKNVFYPILLFPLLSHPKLLPLSFGAFQTDRRTEKIACVPRTIGIEPKIVDHKNQEIEAGVVFRPIAFKTRLGQARYSLFGPFGYLNQGQKL